MPAFTSYANLQQNISDYLARQDLTAQIPMFISLAETRLNRDLRLRQTLQQSTYSMDSGSTVPTPADFLELHDIHLVANPIVPLTFQTVSQFYRRSGVQNQGIPVNYTLIADNFVLSPEPTGASEISMTYFKIPQPMSDTNPTNEYLDVCPDLVLYASLAESAPFLMDDPRLATWQALYAEGLASITKSNQDSVFPAQPLAIQLTT